MPEPLDTSALGPIREVPTGMLTRAELARAVRELAIGEKLVVEKIGERRVRITRGPQTGTRHDD